MGEEAEMVDCNKFLGVQLNNKLDYLDNTEEAVALAD